MRHPELAARIRRMVADEQFDEAEKLLPKYAAAVVEECITSRDEASFAAARTFLRSTIIELRARRSHLAQTLREMQEGGPYIATARRRGELDITG